VGSDSSAGRLGSRVLRRLGLRRPARRLGKPVFDLHGRGELLALTYSLGGLAVLGAWAIDPEVIGNRAGMAALLTSVFVAAAVIFVFKDRLPRYAGDIAIVGSLVLIDVGLFLTKLHLYPALLSPFFVWVGFASPLWFPRARAILYAFLAVVASGIVVIVSANAASTAGWLITMATLVVAFTITEFLSESLVKRERLAVVGEMASVVGHDLRNPLGAVQNALFLLRYGLGDGIEEEQQRHFEMAEREIVKASGIIEQLSAFVRPGEPVLARTELAGLVAEVLEVTPAPEGVEVELETPPTTVLADRGHLAQVLTNLLTNAYDAMGQRGKLRIAVRVDGQIAELEVQDEGPGIDKASVERVFEPFYTTKHRGTGLGLAIVRRLVEAHGGTVRVEASPNGTRFTVLIPGAERAVSPSPPATSLPGQPTAPTSHRAFGHSSIETSRQ